MYTLHTVASVTVIVTYRIAPHPHPTKNENRKKREQDLHTEMVVYLLTINRNIYSGYKKQKIILSAGVPVCLSKFCCDCVSTSHAVHSLVWWPLMTWLIVMGLCPPPPSPTTTPFTIHSPKLSGQAYPKAWSVMTWQPRRLSALRKPPHRFDRFSTTGPCNTHISINYTENLCVVQTGFWPCNVYRLLH